MSCRRYLPFLFLFAIAQTSNAGESEQETHTQFDNEKLWSLYLKPPAEWPQKAAHAEKDILPLPPAPQENTDQVKLGRALFHAQTLSSNGRVSCANCHVKSFGFGDPLALSLGVDGRQGKRNSPPLLNIDLWETLFWDGRATDLADQAIEPLTHHDEMNSTPEAAIKAVKRNRKLSEMYGRAFNGEALKWGNMALALAAFQRTLRGPSGKFDTFYHALENQNFDKAKQAMSTQELHGLHLYRTKAACVNCHNGELFSDQKFHNTGLHYFGRRFEDLGLYEVTKKNEDMGKFRTPMLRHVHLTSPWMHNGLFDNMRGIIRMYAHGGARPARPKTLHEEQYYPETTDILRPFSLTREEEEALLAFLEIL